jgi:hypothetical protein
MGFVIMLQNTFAVVLFAVMLAGCSSGSSLPYPNFLVMPSVENTFMSKETRLEIIEELGMDQKEHRNVASQ